MGEAHQVHRGPSKRNIYWKSGYVPNTPNIHGKTLHDYIEPDRTSTKVREAVTCGDVIIRVNTRINLVHPKLMKVDYPKNIDDEFDAADESEGGLSLTNPTSTSAFIYRIRFAEICREVVDTIPAVFLESTHQVAQTLDYEAILSLDRKLQLFIHSLPYFFPLDQSSIQQSQGICRQRPYIAWQRVMLHLSIHGCIC